MYSLLQSWFYWTEPLKPGESTKNLFDMFLTLGEYEGEEVAGVSGKISPCISFAANAVAAGEKVLYTDAFKS